MSYLKDMRTSQGYLQSTLAEASGVPMRTIQNWEIHGIEKARVYNLVKVAETLGCGLDDLVYGASRSVIKEPPKTVIKEVEKIKKVPIEKIVEVPTLLTCTLSDVTNYGEYNGYPIKDVFGRFCNRCHYELPDIMSYIFCPYCGAKVTGVE